MVDRAIRREGSLRQERRPVPIKRRYPNLATLRPPANTRWDAMVKAYESIGFRLCYGPALEAGVEKLALFGKTDQHGRIRPTHAALQLSCGNWTSKLGDFEDVIHRTTEDVNGPQYGEVVGYMARPRISAT